MPRILPSLAVVLALLAATSLVARADEVFVLDNGMVLRGTAVKETAGGVVIRLADFAEDARVTVEPARIVRRYGGSTGRPPAVPSAMARATDVLPSATGEPASARSAPWLTPPSAMDVAEEPEVRHEGFFARVGRLLRMAVPAGTGSLVSVGLLLLGALLTLLFLGGRLLEIEGLTIGRGLFLSAALGGVLAANLIYADILLRADRALWVLPAQGLAWIGLSFGLLRCQLGKAVLLLAFLLFSVSVMVFTAGAVLMSF